MKRRNDRITNNLANSWRELKEEVISFTLAMTTGGASDWDDAIKRFSERMLPAVEAVVPETNEPATVGGIAAVSAVIFQLCADVINEELAKGVEHAKE